MDVFIPGLQGRSGLRNLKETHPQVGSTEAGVSSKSPRFPLSEVHAQLTKQAVLGEAQVLSSAMTMTHCEEVTPPPPSQGALISAVGRDLIKTFGFSFYCSDKAFEKSLLSFCKICNSPRIASLYCLLSFWARIVFSLVTFACLTG